MTAVRLWWFRRLLCRLGFHSGDVIDHRFYCGYCRYKDGPHAR